MPILSAFTPCGLLEFSSEPSFAEKAYNAQIGAMGCNLPGAPYDISGGTHEGATAYARAMVQGVTWATVRRAANQSDVAKAQDNLPNLEADFLVSPGANDTVYTRQQRLVAIKKLPRGCVFTNVVAALRTVLGTSLLSFRPVAWAEATVYPSNPLTSPQVNATDVRVPSKTCALVDAVVVTGSPSTVLYTNQDPTSAEVDFLVGDVVMVQPDNTLVAEKVTITSVSAPGAIRTFTATFTKAHDAGAIVTTRNWPWQFSTSRLAYAVVTAAIASDPESRRKVSELLQVMLRAVDQFAIVTGTVTGPTGGTIGPLSAGTPMGTVPIGTLNYLNTP